MWSSEVNYFGEQMKYSKHLGAVTCKSQLVAAIPLLMQHLHIEI
jgi:hypothetical protein